MRAFIPESTEIISKYGFNNCSGKFYIAQSSFSDDWDSLWAGTSSPNVSYNFSINKLEEKYGFVYAIYNNNEIILLDYTFESNNIVLPSEIDGITVTTIGAYFENRSVSSRYYYIPSSIVKAEKYAFYNTGSYPYMTFEASKEPDGFDDKWILSSSYNYYVSFNQRMPIIDFKTGFVYQINENEVSIISYLYNNSNVYIPRKINGITVTTIKSSFMYTSNARNIYVPESITTIESSAFKTTSKDYWNFYFENDSSIGNINLNSLSYVNKYYKCSFYY